MNAHVLITGGSGYLGSALFEHLLDAGCSITVLDKLIYGQRRLFHLFADRRFELVFNDTRDESLLRRLFKDADMIIPLMAIVGASAYNRDLCWLARSSSRRFIFTTIRRSRRRKYTFPTISSFTTTSDRMKRQVTGCRTKFILGHRRRWRRLRRLRFDMDWFEIVVPEASGKAAFSGDKTKMAFNLHNG